MHKSKKVFQHPSIGETEAIHGLKHLVDKHVMPESITQIILLFCLLTMQSIKED